MSDLISHIIVCNDLKKAYENIEEKYSDKRLKFFTKEDFLLDDAKEVVKEAYIAESELKILVLGAKTFNIYAQNSLLKILEEPPQNIIFILVSISKSAFLPTIRSRMVIEEFKIPKNRVEFDINLKNFVLQDIYEFVKNNDKIDKNELKSLIEEIVNQSLIKYGLKFTSKELSYFDKLLQLAHLNTRPNVILTSLLLSILKRRENETI